MLLDDFKAVKALGGDRNKKVCLVRRNAEYFVMKIVGRVQVSDRIKECIKLNSECIVRLHHTFQVKDKIFLITEYVKGVDLSSLIRKLGRIEERV